MAECLGRLASGCGAGVSIGSFNFTCCCSCQPFCTPVTNAVLALSLFPPLYFSLSLSLSPFLFSPPFLSPFWLAVNQDFPGLSDDYYGAKNLSKWNFTAHDHLPLSAYAWLGSEWCAQSSHTSPAPASHLSLPTSRPAPCGEAAPECSEAAWRRSQDCLHE